MRTRGAKKLDTAIEDLAVAILALSDKELQQAQDHLESLDRASCWWMTYGMRRVLVRFIASTRKDRKAAKGETAVSKPRSARQRNPVDDLADGN